MTAHNAESGGSASPEPRGEEKPEETAGEQARNDTLSTTGTSLLSRERWRGAARTVRDQSSRLASILSQPMGEHEAGLGSSIVDPEKLGSTDDDELAAIFRRNGNGNEAISAAQYQQAVRAEAERLMQGMKGAPAPSNQPQGDVEATAQPPAAPSLPGGVLAALLQLQSNGSQSRTTSLYSAPESESGSQATLVAPLSTTPTLTSMSTPTSPTRPKVKPRHWYKKSDHTATASLVRASMNMGHIASSNAWAKADVPQVGLQTDDKKKKKTTKDSKEVKLTIHIAEIIFRQRYIMQLCRAFMRYGAPTHRLEEYMQMTARVLDINAQFMYLPGCMIMSFDDPVTRTAEVKLIRVPQGLDLGRLEAVHHCYKRVTHDMVDIQTAIAELTELMDRKPRYNKWLVILLYGLGSAAVGPFGFSARPIDLPIIFFLGCCVGFMQHVLMPRSALYANVFEVSAAIIVSFLARAFGSIRLPGHTDPIFCYASITESSIALILPGFSVLTSSLELQSHQMIAGSIRLVYTIIYSLFLGYGVTVGTTIYGAMDSDATSDTTCARQSVWGSVYTQHFPFVAVYCLIAALINQAKLRQTPIMVLIGTAGYITNYFSTQRLGSSSEVANTVGAFTIGLLANLYSRIWHGNAVSSTIPGIFTLVPSGLASSGSILSAIEYSDAVRNGTADTSGGSGGTSLTSLGYGMIQTAIGITVGLFVSALIVYPHGKRRSGLFSL
ncbi:threonine/serine exporter family protein [Aspergillus mulundensis]|uniref:Threonine/serine exporter-like N-terminal domain-containing protein n=1 Tax=Aspergillus mulundensis TaxID=1810919 RepID=A0A3D8SC00_9EURO|nr:hypothetical protein DSM5745_03940 [Aspergillus mulundensis]RDW83614.1 hypothetical protein DSM5745_03940 [Aspergillus mulundensis]